MTLFDKLETIRHRPKPFEYYTSPQLWNDPHISKGMLDAHLDQGHDVGSYREGLIDKGVDWMASRFDISKKTRICDFGCGPGLWTTRFAERGAQVTGVDLSERSIRYAQEVAKGKNLAIRYLLQDYLAFSTDGPFDLITMIHGDFSVLSPTQITAMLQRLRTVLADDGKLFIEAFSMAHFRAATEATCYTFSAEKGYWSAGSHHLFKRRFKYEQEHVLCDKYTVVDKARELEIYVWVQCYGIAVLKELFKRNGLQIIAHFSDMAGTPLKDEDPQIMLVATKAT